MLPLAPLAAQQGGSSHSKDAPWLARGHSSQLGTSIPTAEHPCSFLMSWADNLVEERAVFPPDLQAAWQPSSVHTESHANMPLGTEGGLLLVGFSMILLDGAGSWNTEYPV